MACETIRDRLFEIAKDLVEAETIRDLSLENGFVHRRGERTSLDWQTLVMDAHLKRVNLSEHSHYATPGINFDWSTAKGHPFSYHVYGAAIVGVTVDCLRGRYEVDYVKCCHDFGSSMNTAVDNGQIEGGIVQGIGWMTMEEVVYDDAGKLRSNALSTYKVPDIYSIPKEISILPLETDRENLAIFNSKAVGEPPLMYGIGAYFAIRNAVKAFKECESRRVSKSEADNTGEKTDLAFDAPFTPEKVLMTLYALR
jgi:xanthine dehydrogenase large subunit